MYISLVLDKVICTVNWLHYLNKTRKETDAVPFLFLVYFSRTPYCFFYCFVQSNLIRWHLKLLARALVSDVCFLSI